MDVSTPPLKMLTERQIDIIKSSWAIPYSCPQESGEEIFYTFLERHPEHKHRYPTMKNIKLEDLRGTVAIRRHSGKIMKTLAAAIDALGTDHAKETVVTIVSDMADYHARKDIKKEYFLQIREVILETLTKVCSLNDEGKEAWNDLMDIINHITFNVLDELKK